MKNLTFALLLCLSGCLTTTNHHPFTENRAKEKPWWTTPVFPNTDETKNPWYEFVRPAEKDGWSNPWAQEDLRDYGVDVLPGSKAKKKVVSEAF